MKTASFFPILLCSVALVSGCRTYHYQLVQPPQFARRIVDEPVTIQYDPLEYHFQRHHDRLSVQIANPTTDRIVLQGTRSFVVDTQGESHPVPGRVIGPQSHTSLLLPPKPIVVQTPYPYGYGYGSGWGGWGGAPGY